MTVHKEVWEIEKEKILIQKKQQHLLESLPNLPHRKGWAERGPQFEAGDHFIHPSTQEFWLAVGPFSPTWGTEVCIYSASISKQMEEWKQRLMELEDELAVCQDMTTT